MTDVFLSYSRKDTDSVKELFASLGARNREVWIDLHGIEYSSKWWDEICAGIDGADNFVLIVSQNSLESLFCHREINHALKHNKRIIPFLLKPVDEKAMLRAWQNDPELCKYEQLTRENWESIQSIQWIDFTQLKDIEKGVDALLETVDTDPERVKLHTRLLLRMRDWEGTGRNPSGLLRGDELALYEKWFTDSKLKETPPHPTDEQEAYIKESRRVQDELEAKRIQRERLVKRFRVAAIALGIFFILAVAATIMSIQREAKTNIQVAAGNTQIAISEKTLTPIPPTLTAVAQTVVAGSYMIESLNLSADANSILRTEGGNAETAALLSIRVLSKIYLPSADAALMDAASRLKAVPFTIPTKGFFPRVDFSPDGKTFVVGLTGGADPNILELRDAVTGNLIWANDKDFSMIGSVAFSPDGKLIVLSTSQQTAVIVDASDGKQINVLSGHRDGLRDAIFSPDSKNVLTLGDGSDRTVRLWDVETGKQIYSISPGAGSPSLIFFPDGKTFFANDNVYNTSDGSRNRESGVGGGTIAISPDGKTFVSGLSSTASLRSVSNGSTIREFAGHTDSVVTAAFSGDGKWLITGSMDNTARVWDVATGNQVLILSGNISVVESVAISPDGTQVLTGSNTARLWNISLVDQQLVFSVPAAITSSALAPDGKSILIGDEVGNSGLWDLGSGKLLHEFPKDNHDVKTVAFSPDGTLVAMSVRSQTAADMAEINLYALPKGTLKKTFTITNFQPFITALFFSADGKTLMITINDNESQIIDIESGQILRSINSIGNISAVSPDGSLIAFNGGTGWWNIATETGFALPNGMNGYLTAFSVDGSLIAFASGNNELTVWDFTTKQLINRFSGHTNRISSLAISADNKWLLSGSVDNTARLWNIESGQMVRVYSGHTAAVTSVRFIEGGKKIITTSMDKSVRIWITDYNDLLTYVCTLIGSDLTAEERVLYGVSDQDPTCPQFGQQPQAQVPTVTPTLTLMPLPIWTPIATPTLGNVNP
ncbi:MAG: hypothetical protein C0410_13670 [Anaerolinea sp.]|nr:hypothetical protein [Anaerolinea sp.]